MIMKSKETIGEGKKREISFQFGDTGHTGRNHLGDLHLYSG